jgi:hypothetical protein
MGGTYTHGQGTIEFRDGCKVIHQGNSFNVVDGAFLCLNGASLIYDSLNKVDRNPFTFSNQATQKVVLNGGEIRSSIATPPLVLEGTAVEFSNDYNLTLQSSINVVNPAPGTPINMSVNFNGHALTFPLVASPLLAIDPNVTVTLSNIELFDYNQDCVSYADATASLNFGLGTKIKLFKTESITNDDRAWEFLGDAIISGKGAALNLAGNQRITVSDGTTLTLEDLRLIISDLDSLKMLGPNAKIIFDNCDLTLLSAAGLLIDTGSVDVVSGLRVTGGDATDVDISSVFSFASTGTFTVKNASLLRLGKNVIFEYRADPSNDGGSVYASKRHFILAGATAVLELDGCTLHSTGTGLAIDYGRIIVSDASTFIIDGSDGSEAEIGSAVDVYVKPSVSFSITGTLAYNPTVLG